MDKIKEYMDKTLTLKELLKWMAGIVTSLALLGFTWLKAHEDRQDEYASKTREKANKTELLYVGLDKRVKLNEEFKVDVQKELKDIQKDMNKKHIEALEMMSDIKVLVERNSKINESKRY